MMERIDINLDSASLMNIVNSAIDSGAPLYLGLPRSYLRSWFRSGVEYTRKFKTQLAGNLKESVWAAASVTSSVAVVALAYKIYHERLARWSVRDRPTNPFVFVDWREQNQVQRAAARRQEDLELLNTHRALNIQQGEPAPSRIKIPVGIEIPFSEVTVTYCFGLRSKTYLVIKSLYDELKIWMLRRDRDTEVFNRLVNKALMHCKKHDLLGNVDNIIIQDSIHAAWLTYVRDDVVNHLGGNRSY